MDRLQIPPNIGEIAAQLMSNPQIMNIMNGMNNNSSGQPPFTDRTQERGGDLSGGGDMGSADISGMLGRLMSDPQIMGLIGSLSGSMGQSSGGRRSDDLDGERVDRGDEHGGSSMNRDDKRSGSNGGDSKSNNSDDRRDGNNRGMYQR